MDTTLVAVLSAGVAIIGSFIVSMVAGKAKERRTRLDEARCVIDKSERAEREKNQARAHQLNHGRATYNWLRKELMQYEDVGIKVSRIEDNLGSFSIYIVRTHDETYQGYDHLIQLDYDFVGYPAPYLGHIHYGAIGEDFLIWVGDHAPKLGLHRFVLDVIKQEATFRRDLRIQK